MLKRRLQKTKQGQYFLTLPNQLVRLKGWKKFDDIIIAEDKGNIVLKR